MKTISRFAAGALALAGSTLTTRADAWEYMMFTGADGTYKVFATTLPGVGKVPVRGTNGSAVPFGTRGPINPQNPRMESNIPTGANTMHASGKYLLTGRTWSSNLILPAGEQTLQFMTPGAKIANDQPEHPADRKRKHSNVE